MVERTQNLKKKRTIKSRKYISDGFFLQGDEDCPTWTLIHTHIWSAGEEKPFSPSYFIAIIFWDNKRIKTTHTPEWNPFFFFWAINR